METSRRDLQFEFLSLFFSLPPPTILRASQNVDFIPLGVQRVVHFSIQISNEIKEAKRDYRYVQNQMPPFLHGIGECTMASLYKLQQNVFVDSTYRVYCPCFFCLRWHERLLSSGCSTLWSGLSHGGFIGGKNNKCVHSRGVKDVLVCAPDVT